MKFIINTYSDDNLKASDIEYFVSSYTQRPVSASILVEEVSKPIKQTPTHLGHHIGPTVSSNEIGLFKKTETNSEVEE